MAEQSSRDVVDHLSGGEPSPSDVPASTTDNSSAGGDAGKTEHIAMKITSKDETPNGHETAKTFDSPEEGAGSDKDTGSRTTTVRIDLGCAHTPLLIWREHRVLDLLRPECLSSTDWHLHRTAETTQPHKAVRNQMRAERTAGTIREMAL